MKEIDLTYSDYTLFTGMRNGKEMRKKKKLNKYLKNFAMLNIKKREDQVITSSFLSGLISAEIIFLSKKGLTISQIKEKITFSSANDLQISELSRAITRLLHND